MQKSESVKELATAMVAAQKVMRHATKDTTNPFFKSKYADFASVWDACREALNNNGIAVSQLVGHDGDDILVETVFLHTSGEWMSSNIKMAPVKKDPQSIGSAITYARRYALSGMACIATEEDDDGNSATGNKTAPIAFSKTLPVPSKPGTSIAPGDIPDAAVPPAGAAAPVEDVINQAQRKMFYASCKGAGLMDEQIKRLMMEKTGVDSSMKLDNAKMNTILAIVRDAKAVADLKIAWAKVDIGGE